MRLHRIIPFVFLLAFFSCKKDTIEQIPVKDIVACINGPLQTENATGNTYTWCGENADEVEWKLNGSAVLAVGANFTPVFTNKGKQVISATGKNAAYSKEINLEVAYGINSKIICRVTVLYPTLGNKKNFWAFLYNSKSDWVTDAIKGNHKLAADSVNCRDTTAIKGVSHFAFFKNVYATGSKKLVTVEYLDPLRPTNRESSWHHAYNHPEGNVIVKNEDGVNDTCSVYMDRASKWIFTMKWNLTQIDTGFGAGTATQCAADDYVRFYPDGTWKYFPGTDFCVADEETSSGVFVTLPYLTEGGLSVIQTNEGPLKRFGAYAWVMSDTFESSFWLAPKGALVLSPNW
ncbi:MAG: hypothetical protein IT236_11810 [Bacteroidia bacterium]|nr:hypothetical protein [Bacteroidia bacterium]